MTRYAKAPRVGNALAIDKQHVRRGVKGLKHRGEDGGLSEGEQSRDIWECHFRVSNAALDCFQFRVGQDYHGHRGPAFRTHTRYIQTSHQLWLLLEGADDYPVR